MKTTIIMTLVAMTTTAIVYLFPSCRELTGANSVRTSMKFCAPSFDPAKMNEGESPIFEGLGNLHFAVSTKNKKAQQYFNQAVTLLYAFNHGEAGRSFRSALKHDSTLAMAWWGMGLVLGPNYNAPLNPTSLGEINAVMQKAIRYAPSSSQKEQALIYALAKRFPKDEVTDMTPYNEAYAAAMKAVFKSFPNDPEITALYADALMNEHPWNFFLRDGSPQPWTAPVLLVLEDGLKKFPRHPGINHSYIHAIEAAADASKGLASADLLSDLLPAAGHLVHMPAHIYIRTGDYHKGVQVTEKAIVADSTYVAQCKVQGLYPLLYYPHNIHFLAACAFFEGNSKKALDAAWMVARKADQSYIQEVAAVQHFTIIPYYVMVQLGKWDEILELQQPGSLLKYPTAIWHYARGMAFAAKGKMNEAKKALAAIKKIGTDETMKTFLIWEMNSTYDLISIAALTLEGELMAYEQQYDVALTLFHKAINIEDRLLYTEPPDWFFSVRLTAGHWMTKARNFAEAEKLYREDLLTFKENGFALMGLYNALQGQRKTAEAAHVKKRFDTAWQYADMEIVSSRKM